MSKNSRKRIRAIEASYLRANTLGYRNFTFKSWHQPCITTDGRLFISSRMATVYDDVYHYGYYEVESGVWKYINSVKEIGMSFDEVPIVKIPYMEPVFDYEPITKAYREYILDGSCPWDDEDMELYDIDPMFEDEEFIAFNEQGYE